MTADDLPKFFKDPPDGEKHGHLNHPTDASERSESTFQHVLGSGHNLIRLLELFVEAWVKHCDEMDDYSLVVPDQESARELQEMSLEVDRRISRELMRLSQGRQYLQYDEFGGDDRHIFHVCIIMSKAFLEMGVTKHAFAVGTALPFHIKKAFYRAVNILSLRFSSEEDMDSGKPGTKTAAVSRVVSVEQHKEDSGDRDAAELLGAEDPPAASMRQVSALSAAALRAYQQYRKAMSESPALKTDDEIYNWVKENEGADTLPSSPETWKRNLRSGRAHHGAQKHRPRRLMRGRSVVGGEQLEAREDSSTG